MRSQHSRMGAILSRKMQSVFDQSGERGVGIGHRGVLRFGSSALRYAKLLCHYAANIMPGSTCVDRRDHGRLLNIPRALARLRLLGLRTIHEYRKYCSFLIQEPRYYDKTTAPLLKIIDTGMAVAAVNLKAAIPGLLCY